MQHDSRPELGRDPGGRRDHSGGSGYRGGGGGTRRGQSDDDYREKIRGVFGKEYVELILEPHRHGYNDFIARVKDFVENRARQITTHQLRNIFTRVRAAREPAHLFVLRPQLAYVAGRSDRSEMRELVVLLDDLIQAVNSPERVAAFRDFYEAVIAYHKYYNPKGS